MSIVVRREAEADILDAFRWYESKRPGLGLELLAEVEAAFLRAAQAPGMFPIAHRDLRRLVLRRFPYVIYFREQEDLVLVIGVLHGRRHRDALRRRTAPR